MIYTYDFKTIVHLCAIEIKCCEEYLRNKENKDTNLISTSLNVVNIAYVFWESFNLCAILWRILVIFAWIEIKS